MRSAGIILSNMSSIESQDTQRAVVWDLDGVIVDSTEAHNLSWQVMARHYNMPYDPENDFKQIFGRHNNDIISDLWHIDDPARSAEMALVKETAFRERAGSLKPLPGVVRLIRELAERGWKQAIGSSAPLENIEVLLKATGLGSYMQAISSGNDVKVGKPNPQVFLIAFERIGVDPTNGVVIEDAPAGIQAGVRAGAATLGVTITQTRATLQQAGADRIVDSLESTTVDDLEQLVRERQEKAGERSANA